MQIQIGAHRILIEEDVLLAYVSGPWLLPEMKEFLGLCEQTLARLGSVYLVTLVGPGTNERAKRFEIGVKALGKLSRLAYGVGVNLNTFSVSDEVELRILGEFDKAF